MLCLRITNHRIDYKKERNALSSSRTAVQLPPWNSNHFSMVQSLLSLGFNHRENGLVTEHRHNGSGHNSVYCFLHFSLTLSNSNDYLEGKLKEKSQWSNNITLGSNFAEFRNPQINNIMSSILKIESWKTWVAESFVAEHTIGVEIPHLILKFHLWSWLVLEPVVPELSHMQ